MVGKPEPLRILIVFGTSLKIGQSVTELFVRTCFPKGEGHVFSVERWNCEADVRLPRLHDSISHAFELKREKRNNA